MKIFPKIFITGFLFFQLFSLSGQNWNVFNSAYRYNYRFDTTAYITDVLFADSVNVIGQDTLYKLNRIARRCNGTCLTTTVTEPSGQRYYVIDLPEFLQRKIYRAQNGWTRLYDTTNLAISPSGVLNQTWIFDSIQNNTATLVSKGIRNVFGNNDSVKVIMINGLDSLILSKTFGIIAFPEPYGKNKYYRLIGVETNHKYQQNALFGKKLINAWDIYNFQPGDVFCAKISAMDGKHINGPRYLNGFIQTTIISKSVTSTGYQYQADQYNSYTITPLLAGYSNPGTYNDNITLTFDEPSLPHLFENKSYPNSYCACLGSNNIKNFYTSFPMGGGQLGISSVGVLPGNIDIKYAGNGYNPLIPGLTNGIEGAILDTLPGSNGRIYREINYYGSFSSHYAAGFGILSQSFNPDEMSSSSYLSCFERNGVPVFGHKIIGVQEYIKDLNTVVYPQPADAVLKLHGEGFTNIRITDLLGKTIYQNALENVSEINVQDFGAGIYIMTAEDVDGSFYKGKICIQH